MYCTRKITDDLTWVGADNRRVALFEGVYKVPRGMSYNSYLLLDEKTVLFDTVDREVCDIYYENVEHTLNGRKLDYLVIHHMEPDHSAGIVDLLLRYPDVKVVCNPKSFAMFKQFTSLDIDPILMKEGDVLDCGKHKLKFFMAPMVHWPEVMVSYDETDGILFTADAFGTFGALNGAMFADEVNFDRDYLDEARRYYCNIVGKYGVQVKALLTKVGGLKINTVCPLHGFVWRENFDYYVNKYMKWATYEPEEEGVVIAYASVYGNTANAANILSCRLREKGIKTVMFDVSVSEHSEVVANIFKFSHAVFAAPTYNGGIFIRMDECLRDIVAHGLKNRTFAFVENGSWAPMANKQMVELMSTLKNITVLENKPSIKSSLNEDSLAQIEALADEIAGTFNK